MAVYFYKNLDLQTYCANKNINYLKIYRRLYYMRHHCLQEDLSIEEKIDVAIEHYQHRRKFEKIKRCFKILETTQDYQLFKWICVDLKINYKQVINYYYKGYDKKRIILYIWFFGDIENSDGEKSISRKRFYQIENHHFKEQEKDIYHMIAYYRCGNKEYLSQIFKDIEKMNLSIIYKILKKNNYYGDKEKKEELLLESNLIMMNILNNIVSNNLKQTMKYIHIALNKRLNHYLKENFRYHLELKENVLYHI